MRDRKDNFRSIGTVQHGSRITHHASRRFASRRFASPRAVWFGTFLLATTTLAAEVDLSKLPPSAARTVDFERDVRPIFESSCLRCHGPERPKSGFRLDNRESALKGGANDADDIVPGDSARSRLIHYVARLVEGMEMPPGEKDPPLTAEQIGVLRAWIDQGANWGATRTYPQSALSISPALRWIDVSGDRAKFRELQGLKEGWGGGVEQFSIYEQRSADRTLTADGHVLVRGRDYRVRAMVEQTGLGFVRGGVERWRRYYDDTGGYYPFTTLPPSFDLGRELYLDIGRVWFDLGLKRPGWPEMVLGYELQFREGDKAALAWGPVYDPGVPDGKNIYPAARSISERTHVVKFDFAHEFQGWRFEDNARVEFFRTRTRDNHALSYSAGPAPDAIIRTRQEHTHIQGANSLRVEKQITQRWFGSGGYLYSQLSGDASLDQLTVDAANNPVFGNLWSAQVTLRRDVHLFSLASLFQAAEGLNLSVSAQAEFARQEGFGDVNLDFDDPANPGAGIFQPAVVRSDLDQLKTTQNAALRYTRIPFTVLFAEGRFAQDQIGHFEEEAGSSTDVFLRDTDYTHRESDLRAGFHVSPRRWIALNAHYRRRDRVSDFDHVQDTNLYVPPGSGYSAFIRHRETVTDEVEARLVLRPASWLKTTLSYRLTASDFVTGTDPEAIAFSGGGELEGGRQRAHVYGFSTVFTASQRLYLAGTLTYSDTRTTTWAQRLVAATVAPYEGGLYTVIASANYALNPRTSLQGAYSFSRAEYGQENTANGLPLGLDYTRHALTAGVTRQLTAALLLNLRYGFYRYEEPSSAGVNDFTGHGLFATMTVRWP